jgi:hypothetical protein
MPVLLVVILIERSETKNLHFAILREGWGTMNSGCPTLAAFLFLRLGWEMMFCIRARLVGFNPTESVPKCFVSGHGFSRADWAAI